MRTRRTIAVIGLLVLLVGLVSFGVVAQSRDKDLPTPRVVKGRPLTVAFVTKGFESEATQRNYAHFKIEAAYRGWKIVEVTSTAEKAGDAVRAVIEKDVDAIVGVYQYFDYWRDEVIMARKKGIGVYSIDTEIKPGVIVCPRQFDGAAGARVMETLIDMIGYKGNVAMLAYHMHEGVDRRNAGAEAIARWYERKGVRLVEYQDITYPGYDVQGYNIAQTWVRKYGKDLDAIFAGFDIPAIFAARAFQAAGYTSRDLVCGGIDGGKQALAAIRDPKNPFKVTYSQPFELYTHITCEVIDKIQVKGMPIDEAIASVGGDPTSGNVFLDGILITSANVPPAGATYYELHRYYGENPNDPNAWVNWYKKVKLEPYRT